MPVRPGGVCVPHREGSCMWREVLNSPGTTSPGAPISFLPQLPVSDGQHLGSDTCSLGIGNMNHLNTRFLGPALRMGSSVPWLWLPRWVSQEAQRLVYDQYIQPEDPCQESLSALAPQPLKPALRSPCPAARACSVTSVVSDSLWPHGP